MKRTLAIQTVNLIGRPVLLFGWVNSIRDHGQLTFIDLRDRSGLVQVVFKGSKPEISQESVVRIQGKVVQRAPKTVNPNLPTGTIEVTAETLDILAKAETTPFDIYQTGYDINEALRLKYRYLDLRRPRLNQNLRLRSKLINLAREYLFKNDFVEIETPLLSKSTPEGSRDFLVPSRIHPGKFYALPQSPQQYKQLLMVAGFERYFQIARALRDEDLRADRAFEHTQIDIEISFSSREEIMALVENLTIQVIEALGGKILKKPFPVYSYQEAMNQFGSDKFDLRSSKEKKGGLNAFAWVIDFPFFEKDKEGNWTFTHNPFSDPVPEHKQAFLKGEIESIKTSQYDLVWNGAEAGGGSVRSTDPRVLAKVFEVLGYSRKEIENQFGHIIKSFTYGVPPHGGIALGVERWVMRLTNEESIREVQAFPMTSGGQTSVMDAPSKVTPDQLKELGLKLTHEKSK